MKTTAAIVAAISVAHAAAPDKSFNVPTLQVGYAKSCRGADTLTVSSTPKALTWRFSDFGSAYPEAYPGSTVAFCVMVNEIGSTPTGWRFAVDSLEMSGSGKLTGGAQLDQLGTSLGFNVAYVTNPGARVDELIWALRYGGWGDYNVHNTTLNADGKDLDGTFNVKVPSQTDIWSPCWPEDVNRDRFQLQFTHQTYFYMGQTPNATNPRGKIDDNFQVAINLKWEKCDPAPNRAAVKKPNKFASQLQYPGLVTKTARDVARYVIDNLSNRLASQPFPEIVFVHDYTVGVAVSARC
ncbi:hypothetical protein NUW58_g8533 [Xylaria curta]|uniref:Uncharacterized protein n=1 Tax=Xylaria curta TaxID=42375 RepID=A0ACC1N7R2_9PEZI|nr:hypothetical protein NUW58_g8533 [Xylaria curta]